MALHMTVNNIIFICLCEILSVHENEIYYFIMCQKKKIFSELPFNNNSHEAIIDARFRNQRFPRVDGVALNHSIVFAQTLINHLSTLERNIANAGVELQMQSPAQKQFLDSYPSEDAFQRGIGAIVAMKASSYLLHQNCRMYIFCLIFH